MATAVDIEFKVSIYYAHAYISPITRSYLSKSFIMKILVQLKVEYFWICLSFLL